ncbi:hypothetical protein A9Q84_10430 [Halobacteriovorax marinus]|uniref:HEAT repeat domain-containing protein n=1 Tax=Halobacteriovorax marinus TaxID=97084 RepID=A0A1Y5F768_9BACT|nr:hypothetical protein A9Q84_10430 [Halobacteriovorax marinus]
MKKLFVFTIVGLTALFLSSQFFESSSKSEDLSVSSITSDKTQTKTLRSVASVELGQKLKQLDDLENCLDSRKCGFSNSDSREYDLEVGRAIKVELEKLYEYISDEEIEDEWVSELGRRYIQFEDGHIKEAALMLLSTQAPSDKNLEVVLSEVISFHSAPLVELGLLELTKYKTPVWNRRIDESFMKNLNSGSLVVRQLLAKKISQFLTNDNRAMYKEFAATTNDSKVKRYIEAALSK